MRLVKSASTSKHVTAVVRENNEHMTALLTYNNRPEILQLLYVIVMPFVTRHH